MAAEDRGIDSRRSADATRERLLDAGEQLIRQRARSRSAAVDGALGHIKVAEVAAAAGISKGMVYHLWDSQEDYRRDLLWRVARSTTFESVVATVAPSVLDEFASLDDAVTGLAQLTLDRALGDEQWFLFMDVSSYLANDAIREEMDAGQRDALAATSALYQAGLAKWGMKMRDGYTIEDLVILTRAFSRGVTLQLQVADNGLPDQRPTRPGTTHSLYQAGVLALFDAFVEPVASDSADDQES